MQDRDDAMRLALLMQRFEQMEEKLDRVATEVESLKSSALRVSGGIAVIIVLATLIGWAANFISGLKFK